jgi:hypothetical protein
MSEFCATRRLPRARVDPIDSALVALTMIDAMITRPMQHETIALLLDHERRGLTVLVVSGTDDPDSIIDVIERVVEPDGHDDDLGAVVVASIRPGGAAGMRDVDRWCEISVLCEDAAVDLVEWFVIGRDVTCPRDLLGEPPRWAA